VKAGMITELKRDLGPWAAASMVVGTVIGSGIFLVPHDMVARVGTPAMVFAVWIVGGLLSLAGSLSYAELAAAIPEAGGEYAYLREAYGPVWGFLYSWTQMWVAKSGSIATLATGFFYYLTDFAVTAIKVALIAGIIVVGLGFGTTQAAASAPAATLTTAGFFAALVAALWAYDGWNNVAMVASEVRDPQRNLPRALVGGTFAVICIYLLANAAYFHVLSARDVAANARVASEMMRRITGAAGAHAVSVAAMISIFAALNGSILTGSRVPYAAARDGYFFRAVAGVSPRYHTPGVSILALSTWAAMLVLSGGYRRLFTYVIFASWILYGMTTAAVLILRKKRPDLPRPYKTAGYPLIPIIFVLAALAFVVSTLWDSPRESLMGIVLIVLGLPFYFYWRRRKTSA
jgi:APA family basic amino acid/polyamine antiporter